MRVCTPGRGASSAQGVAGVRGRIVFSHAVCGHQPRSRQDFSQAQCRRRVHVGRLQLLSQLLFLSFVHQFPNQCPATSPEIVSLRRGDFLCGRSARFCDDCTCSTRTRDADATYWEVLLSGLERFSRKFFAQACHWTLYAGMKLWRDAAGKMCVPSSLALA